MKLRYSTFLAACILLQIVGISLFMTGFFPVKVAVPGHSSRDDFILEPILTERGSNTGGNKNTLDPQFGRLVFILIDALRADFVLPCNGNQNGAAPLPQMEFVSGLLRKKEGCGFLAKAHPPTVTMPRIKALTTGGIPGFVDVALNFDTSALVEDNLINQLSGVGKQIVFYGDDTWMRLFPGDFLRSEGTTSFFVTDYTEVDDNVTRHVGTELASDDWDVLILHYLGLDHIGHLAGPYSPLIQPKLQEMDDIVRRIHEELDKQDVERNSMPSLLVLCGDHGMSDQGSHGGSTAPEISTPLVFLSSAFKGGKGATFLAEDVVQQIDMAPTLALALGTAIPQNSLGTVILSALRGLDIRRQLQATYINAQQVLNVFRLNNKDFQNDASYHHLNRAVDSHRAWLDRHLSLNVTGDSSVLGTKVAHQYIKAIQMMRDKVASSLVKYDLHAMAVGAMIVWMVLISLLHALASGTSEMFHVPLTGMRALLCTGAIGLLLSAHMSVCTSPHASPLLCATDMCAVPIVVVTIALTGLWLSVAVTACAVKASIRMALMLCKASYLDKYLIGSTLAHTISLLASSFVEEEHQTWYFWTVTLHCIIAFHLISRMAQPHMKDSIDVDEDMLQSKTVYEKANSWDQNDELLEEIPTQRKHSGKDVTGSRKVDGVLSQGVKKDTNASAPGSIKDIWRAGALLLLSRVARAWNQTGDKWAHLPDIGDWLISPGNQLYLSVAVLGSLVVVNICVWRQSQSTRSRVLFALGSVAVYCFRCANGALMLPGVYTQVTKGVAEARLVYLVTAIQLLCVLYIMVRRPHKTNDPLELEKEQEFSAPSENKDQQNSENQKQTTFIKLPMSCDDDLMCAGLLELQFVWTMLMLLLVRPHNICLVAMVMLQEMCIAGILKRHHLLRTAGTSLVYIWMGQSSFYYQGNSNSIATVDVSAGYIGLEDYFPPLIGCLLCLTTYAGPIFWTISLIRRLAQTSRRSPLRLQRAILEACSILCVTRVLPVAVYVILVSVERYHLFVWTVFSPKLLYEGVHTVVVSIMVFVALLFRTFVC